MYVFAILSLNAHSAESCYFLLHSSLSFHPCKKWSFPTA